MRRIPHWIYFLILFVFFMTTSLNSFFVPYDTFGLTYGYVSYPMNRIVLTTLLLLLTFLAFALNKALMQLGYSDVQSILVSTNISVVLFSLFTSLDYLIGIIYSWGSITLSIASMLIIESDQNEEFLRNVRLFQAILWVISMIITIVNYAIWFIRGLDGIVLPRYYTNAFRDIPLNLMIDQNVFAKKIFTATMVTFTLNGLLFSILTYYVWSRSATLIDKPLTVVPVIPGYVEGDLLVFRDSDGDAFYVVEKDTSIPELSDSVFKEGSQDLAFDIEKIERSGFENYIRLGAEDLLVYAKFRLKTPILLLPYWAPNFEQLFDETLTPIWTHLTLVRHFGIEVSPPELRWVKRILHISTQDLNSSMLRMKLDKIIGVTAHTLKDVLLEDSEEISGEWDVLLVSAHGGLDADGDPYIIDSNGSRYSIDEIVRQVKPTFAMFSSCHIVSERAVNKVIIPMMKGGTMLFSGFKGNVLSSHLNLISLSFIETVLKVHGRLELAHIQQIIDSSFSALFKFGHSSQWAFNRNFIPGFW